MIKKKTITCFSWIRTDNDKEASTGLITHNNIVISMKRLKLHLHPHWKINVTMTLYALFVGEKKVFLSMSQDGFLRHSSS